MSKISVEVAFALPDRQSVIAVEVEEGASMLDAVKASNIEKQYPEYELAKMPMGLFDKAQAKPAEYILKEGDRVCIFRPLIIDPKDNRKERAAKAKAKKS